MHDRMRTKCQKLANRKCGEARIITILWFSELLTVSWLRADDYGEIITCLGTSIMDEAACKCHHHLMACLRDAFELYKVEKVKTSQTFFSKIETFFHTRTLLVQGWDIYLKFMPKTCVQPFECGLFSLLQNDPDGNQCHQLKT